MKTDPSFVSALVVEEINRVNLAVSARVTPTTQGCRAAMKKFYEKYPDEPEQLSASRPVAAVCDE